LVAVGNDAVVSIFDVDIIPHGKAMCGNALCRTIFKTGIDIDWKEFELNRSPFHQIIKEPKQRPTVLAP